MSEWGISGTMQLMELYQLRSFVTIARTGNLTQAADQLFISQPALSAHIKALEEELDIKLFARSAKGMQLTEDGLLLKQKAQQILDQSQDLKLQARALKGDISGTVTIGLNSDSEYLRLTHWHNELLKSYPRLKIQLVQNTSVKLLQEVSAGTLDGSFISGDIAQADLLYIDLIDSEALIAAAPCWSDQMKGASLEQLAKLPWIQPEPQCIYHHFINALFADRPYKPANVTTSSSEETTLKLLLSGVGLSIIRDDEAEALLENGDLVVWREKTFSLPLRFAYQQKRSTDPIIRTVLNTIQKHF